MYIRKRNLVLVIALLIGLGFTGFLYASNPDLAKSSTLQSVLANDKLQICSDVPFSPFEFKSDQGQFVGLDIDIARFAVRAMFGIGTADGSAVQAKNPADEDKLIRQRLEVIPTVFDVIRVALNQGNCDLILSDIKMPGKNGYEIFAAAKDKSADLQVMLMTGFGYDPNHSIVRARKEGLAAVLFKPFKVDQLLGEIHKALAIVRRE